MNISSQLVTDGNSGSVILCSDEQLLNIFEQFVTAGRDGSLVSMSETQKLNKYATLVTAPISKCDKSAYFNERHIWNAYLIVVTNDVFQSGVISINLPQP